MFSQSALMTPNGSKRSEFETNENPNSHDPLEDLAKRLEKCEKILKLNDKMGKLKKDQEYTKCAEDNRKLDHLEKRLKRIEDSTCMSFINLESNLIRHDAEIFRSGKCNQIKDEIDELKYRASLEDPLKKFDCEITEKIESLGKTIKDFKVGSQENTLKIKNLHKYLENIKEIPAENIKNIEIQINKL